jgi:hypothetical protein
MLEMKLGGGSVCPANCTDAPEPFIGLQGLMSASQWSLKLHGGDEALLLAEADPATPRDRVFHRSTVHPQMVMEVARVYSLRING